MKKGVKIAIAISGTVAIILAVGGTIFYVNKNKYNPETVLEEYTKLINEKKYEEMYSKTTKGSKSNISKEDFVKRNKNIYEGIEATNVKNKVLKVKKDGSDYNVTYKSTMNTVAGEVEFTNTAVIRKDDGIEWSSKMIFPDLGSSDKVRVNDTKAKRGSILDKDGNVLAEDGTISEVGIVPGKLGDTKEDNIKKIANLLDVSEEYINTEITASYVQDDTFVPIKDISASDEKVTELLNVPGVMINDKEARVYPLGSEAAHLTGYVQNITADELEKNKGKGYSSSSVIGKVGLEKAYEDTLRGTDGVEIYIEDKDGEKKNVVASSKLKDGEDVTVTIDSNMQKLLYGQLESDKGFAVAMNPNTGEVLAMVSTPSYDPNDFILGISDSKWSELNNDDKKPLFNRFQSTFAPGSSFKPITAAIGLENKSIDATGSKNISGKSWKKDNSWGDYSITRVTDYGASTNLTKAMVYSDNIYFAQVALDVGKENFAKDLTKMGFGEKIPLQYGLYSSQFADDDKFKDDIQLADTGYGQGKLLVNPLHLASMYTAFLNDGNMMMPTLESNNASKVWKENVMSKDTASTVLNTMVSVVEDPAGTGREAKIDGLTIAAKTGTAEIKKSQDDTDGTELGWFAAMTINKDNNNLLVVSMVEDVKDKGGSHYVIPKIKAALETVK
ncbi:penicillin-binding transpeptidase domain-containing protein [Clostridium bornimense]|uniref:penicillin-binding transpeptidase domain-containing protein n=1 Tax=Clostridium bornimense TaxID=1216932 RepID=UPI001C1084DA|nr:penicillin-binding transpeptidase domain-containing protein [Clostridium bornimense]MBU5317466.1 penicillin-binding transpeptidase domain-containing protein [Clostridium bornimense]